jgi:hypothetical protein
VAFLAWLASRVPPAGLTCRYETAADPPDVRIFAFTGLEGPFYIVSPVTAGVDAEGRNFRGKHPRSWESWTLAYTDASASMDEYNIRSAVPSRVAVDILKNPNEIVSVEALGANRWAARVTFPQNLLWLDLRTCGSDPPRPHVFRIEFDEHGRVVKTINEPDKYETRFEYDDTLPFVCFAVKTLHGHRGFHELKTASRITDPVAQVFSMEAVQRLAANTPMPAMVRELKRVSHSPAQVLADAEKSGATTKPASSSFDWPLLATGVAAIAIAGWFIIRRRAA